MKLIRYSVGGILLIISFLIFCNVWIIGQTTDRIYADSRQLIGAEVGLVFGTSSKLIGGDPNPFFTKRMIAAAELIKSGKVEKLILSGSRDSVYYNEPVQMQEALVALGVSKDQLILDDSGNRTLASVARLRDIYGYEQCVMITQQYHAYRCLFIADELGIQAECYQAATPEIFEHKKAILRELFARTKAVIDLYLLYPQNDE
ncbi:YdcF family protein [Reichenbachiella agarivorans]|uniref:YdcF family protein n=1 Tax=Reichenbachiella agarivorans TaxID=2979464 RepID=A0ABY6CTV7_9BACT|nr:ElyC/SanA/YdcF family protein [Reichenbachiella agarivorans]UXP31680.1 YdcF family protein [Reichenbachiella agarivorans]